VIVYDLDIDGVPLGPYEAHAELIIDADAVLAFPVPLQSLHWITRKRRQVFQGFGLVQHGQLALRRAFDVPVFFENRS
jgi:hypothetical protein